MSQDATAELRRRISAGARGSDRLAQLASPRDSSEGVAPRVPAPRVVVRHEAQIWVRGTEGEGALRDVTLIRPAPPAPR